jgi:hypothetical protein
MTESSNIPPGDPPNSAMLEKLTAYLDGELDAVETRQVEERLAADAAWADELRRLQRAWDLLDDLPRAEVGAGFTHTTVEMIAVEAEQDLIAVQTRRPRGRWFDRALLVAGTAAAAAAGFILVNTFRPPADAELFRQLSMLEHFDLYVRTEPTETVEFLKLLRDREPLKPTLPAPKPATPTSGVKP